jgi:iron(III) transport system permease protein
MTRLALLKPGWTILLLLIAALAVYPVVRMVGASFSDAGLGQTGSFTLENYTSVLTSGRFGLIVLNTLWVAVLSTMFAIVCGVGMAWLVVRTNLPFSPLVHVLGMAPFLMPGILSAIGWAMLGNPDIGTINLLWSSLTGSRQPLMNVYSHTGLAFVMGQHAAGFIYIMMVSPLRNIDPGLTETARLCGANLWQTFRKIEFPLILSAVVPLSLLVFVRAMETFEIPAVLGTPANIFLLTNDLYYRLQLASPPQHGSAIAIAVMITAAFQIALVVMAMITSRRSRVSLTGKGFRHQKAPLGRLRWPLFALVIIYGLATSILPYGMVLVGSLFPIFGIYDLSQITLDNYRLLTDAVASRALFNTGFLMVVCSTLAIILGAFVAYAVQRKIVPGTKYIEALVIIPWAMPGLVLGLAMLWAYISVPGFYGTLAALVVAFVTLGTAIGLRSMKAVFEQLSNDLEEAAMVHGASRVKAIRHIVLPLVMPGLIGGWFILAAVFSRELAMSVMLYGPGSEVVPVMVLGYWEQGRGNYAAVLSVVMIGALLVLLGLQAILTDRTWRARLFGGRAARVG